MVTIDNSPIESWIRIIRLLWFKNERYLCNQELYKIEERRKELMKHKYNCEQYIYKFCNHKWERDYSVCSEHSEKYCIYCGL